MLAACAYWWAAASRAELDGLLRAALERQAAANGEAHVVRVLRDYQLERMERWAERTVDDADNRRRHGLQPR